MRVFFLLALLVASSTDSIRAQGSSDPGPTPQASGTFTAERPAPVAGQQGYPALDIDRRHILELLRTGEFQQLEELFGSLSDNTRRDVRQEELLVFSYRSFFGTDKKVAGRFDEWVLAFPNSEAPLLARAEFRRARAWEARGEGLLGRKDRDRAQTMQEHLDAGLADLGRAAQLAPENLAVYSTWLALLYPRGWQENSEVVLQAALRRYPDSYWLRFQGLAGMSPRWGGSYAEMRALIDESQRHIGANPRLGGLRASILLDRANELRLDNDYTEALNVLDEASRYSPGWRLHELRGRVLYFAEDYVPALASYDSAVALHPVSTSVLEFRGRTLARIAQQLAPPEERAGLMGQATVDLAESIQFSQPDSSLARWASWTYWKTDECTTSPVTCFDEPEPVTAETWEGPRWQHILLFVVSIPYTLFLVLVRGHELFLSPAPLLATLACLWSFWHWRKQRYWTPRIIPIMSGICFLTLALINVHWVMNGGTMWNQRYVVIVVATLLPYLVYLLCLGPVYMKDKRPQTGTGSWDRRSRSRRSTD